MDKSEPKLDREELLAHREFVQSLARRLVLDPHQADDVSQEALLAALRNPPPKRGSLRRWLARVVRNLAYRTFRDDSRRRQREARRARPDQTRSTHDVVGDLQLHREVVDALLALDEPYRTTLVMHFFEGLPPREIADRTGTKQATVRSHLKRGIERLRNRLDERHGGRVTWVLALLSVAFPSRVAVSAGTTATGVAFMSTKTKISIAAAVLLFASGVTLTLLLNSTRTQSAYHATARETQGIADESNVLEEKPEVAGRRNRIDRVDRDLDLHGIVVNTAGAPVAGARLRAIHYPWQRTLVLGVDRQLVELGPEAVSASDGSFALKLRRGALVSLRIAAEGYAETEFGRLQAGERVRIVLAVGRTLRVRVRDARGNAVSGATVKILSYGDVSILREAPTDETGATLFTNLPDGDEVLVKVDAFHPAYGKTWGTKYLPLGDEVEIVLPKGRVFWGRITDAETGAAVVGARVGMHHRMEPATVTDKDGRYRINGWMGPGVQHDIHVVSENYVRATREVGVGTEYDFDLVRGTVVSGRLVDTKTQPVGNVRVVTVGSGDRGYSTAHTLSGRNGRFKMTALDPELVQTLIVQAKGYGRTLLDFWPKKDVDLGDIVLRRGRSIEGRLVDSQDRPIPRRLVELVGANADRRRRGPRPRVNEYGNRESRVTDDLGRFRFPDLAAGQYTLEVRRKAGPRFITDVELKEVDVHDVTLRLTQGRPFTVWVHDDAGQPIPSAIVSIESGRGTASLKTDAQGKAVFTINGPVKVVHAPHVFTPGAKWGPAYKPQREDRKVAANATETRFVLQRWDEIRGRVLDIDGKPANGVVLDAYHEGRRVHRAYTDVAGEFRTIVPPRSNIEIRVAGQLTKFRGVYTHDNTVSADTVRASAGEHEVVVHLRRVTHDRTLRVHVVTPEGKPVADANVSCSFGNRRPRYSRTNRDGFVVFKELASRGVTVSVSMPANSELAPPRQQTVDPKGQDLVMRAREAITIVGRVWTESGQPAQGVQVLARSQNHGLTTITDSEGRFRLLVPTDEHSFDLFAIQRDGKGPGAQAYRKGYRPTEGEAVLRLKKIK